MKNPEVRQTNFSLDTNLSILFAALIVTIILSSPRHACSQEIMLDRLVKCGDLVCFPVYNDENKYYYLPDQPRVATKNGRPQFSFLKYARLKETGKAGINRAEGGGILHFLIEYGATPGRVAKAEAALQRKHPKASIAGPVMYRKARFALVTTFNKDNSEFTKIATIGKAPVMEGQKAAVSIGLTREGAEVLWESFKTSTPDISIVIETDFTGIREPYEATLTVDWEKVSKNHHISAGGTYKWFGADIDILLRELRKDGAISLVVKGKDENMDAAWMNAQQTLIHLMFAEIPLDKEVRSEVVRGGFPNLQKALSLAKRSACLEPGISIPERSVPAAIHLNRYPALMAALKALAAQVLGIPEAEAYTFQHKEGSESNPRQSEYHECVGLFKAAKKEHYSNRESIEKALDCFQSIGKEGHLREKQEQSINKAIKFLKQKLADLNKTDTSTKAGSESASGHASASTPSKGTANAGSVKHGGKKHRDSSHHAGRTRQSHRGNSHKHRKGGGKGNKKGGGGHQLGGHRPSGPIGLMVSYRMRRIKRSGYLRLNMKRYASETRHFVMSENIGDLYSRYGHDPKVFRAVLIDDPVYKQREILITLDGQDANTFKKHVNFVTVQMRKVHESGDITRDEIVITPETFNNRANLYEFMYGYSGDRDRDAWLDYEARDIWSFAGDINIEHNWTKHNEAMLSVASPVRYRAISIEADGKRLSDANVRHGVIDIFTTIKGKELKEETTIKNSGPAPMETVEIPVTGETAIEYQITWYLNDGTQVQGDRQPLHGDILYWDGIKGETK